MLIFLVAIGALVGAAASWLIALRIQNAVTLCDHRSSRQKSFLVLFVLEGGKYHESVESRVDSA